MYVTDRQGPRQTAGRPTTQPNFFRPACPDCDDVMDTLQFNVDLRIANAVRLQRSSNERMQSAHASASAASHAYSGPTQVSDGSN